MNYSLSNTLYAVLAVLMFGLSSFAQDASLYDLGIVKMGSRSADSTNDYGSFLQDDRPRLAHVVDVGPLGPGPFQPNADREDEWNHDGPVVRGGISVGNPADHLTDPENSWSGISNGFIYLGDGIVVWETTEKNSWLDNSQGVIWIGTEKFSNNALIDIEDYISRGGAGLYDSVDPTQRFNEDDLLILVIPQDDPDVDPNTGLLIAPWDKDVDGILDQLKELPSDDDRSDHSRD